MTDINITPDAATIELPQGKPVPRPHRRAFASVRAIAALVLREMSTTYGRSPGGYLWAILEPVAGIMLLTTIFSMGFRTPAIGSNFALFYATGLIPLTFFTSLSGRIGSAVTYSRQLMTYPSVTFLDAIIARFLLNTLTQVMVFTVIVGGILAVFDTKVIIKIPVIAGALAMVATLGLGVGTLNCFLFTRFPLWQQLWAILTRPLYVISCVFMIFDQIPLWAREWLWYNPIIHCVGMMRHGVYSTYYASYVSVTYVMGFSLVTGLAGLFLLHHYRYTLLER